MTLSMTVATITIRLLISLLVVILVGVTLVVAWPLILIGVVVVLLSKVTDDWKKPRTIPPVSDESGGLVSRLAMKPRHSPTR